MEQRRGQKKTVFNWAGPHIRRIRDHQGFSQEMLSARCEARGVILSRSTLAKIELQLRCLTDIELLTIARALSVRVKDLFPDQSKLF